MSQPKAVRWSSPANAWAVGALLLSLAIPVLAVAEGYQPTALEEISKLLADTWQWVLLFAALIALLATLIMQFAIGDGARMQAVVAVEAIATVIVAGCDFLLWWALVKEYGWGTAPLTQLLVGGLGVTALGRVGQILWETYKYRRALRRGAIVHTEALAQPKDT